MYKTKNMFVIVSSRLAKEKLIQDTGFPSSGVTMVSSSGGVFVAAAGSPAGAGVEGGSAGLATDPGTLPTSNPANVFKVSGSTLDSASMAATLASGDVADVGALSCGKGMRVVYIYFKDRLTCFFGSHVVGRTTMDYICCIQSEHMSHTIDAYIYFLSWKPDCMKGLHWSTHDRVNYIYIQKTWRLMHIKLQDNFWHPKPSFSTTGAAGAAGGTTWAISFSGRKELNRYEVI